MSYSTPYSDLFFWRSVKQPFKKLHSEVLYNGPTHDVDSQVVTNSVSSPINAFSLQQNVSAKGYWFQNTVIVINGLAYWHLENFDLAMPNANGDGSEYVTMTYAKEPNGTPIDLTSGKYSLLFDTFDDGTDINQQILVVRDADGFPVYQPTPLKSKYHGQLTCGSLPICGFSYGSRANFTAGEVVMEHSFDTPDLAFGGQHYDKDGVPISDEIWGKSADTAETSNMRGIVGLDDADNVRLPITWKV